MSPPTGTSAMCTHLSNVTQVLKGGYMTPSRTLDLYVFVQNVCADKGLTAFEMFDVLEGFTPYSFAKPSFTGGKCLMKQRRVVPSLRMFHKLDLRHDCTFVNEFWAVCRVMPVLLGGS